MELKEKVKIVEKFIDSLSMSVSYVVTDDKVLSQIEKKYSKDFAIVDLACDFSPFKPFLSIIQKEKPSAQIVKEHAYSVQEETFLSYFNNEIASERYDLPIESEHIYERDRFIKTIIELLKTLKTRKFIFLNSQTLFINSFELIKALEKVESDLKFLFFFDIESFNITRDSLDFLANYSASEKLLFLQNSKSDLFDTSDFTSTNQNLNNLVNYSVFFNDPEEFYKSIRNNRLFICKSQLRSLIDWAYKNISRMECSSEQKRKILYEIAISSFISKLEDEAVLYFNDLADANIQDNIELASLYYLAKIFYLKKSGDYAKKYTLRVKQKLESNIASPYSPLVSMMEFQFVNRKDAGNVKEKYLSALEELDKFGYINNYISTGLTIPGVLINDEKSRPLIDKTINKCMELSKQIGNKHLYSSACHWKGIIASHYGESEEVLKWYNKCNQLRTEIGELGPLMNIRNGFSYESMCRAKYKDAYNLVNEIIRNIYSLNDYSRIIDCLKNISYALFYSRHYKVAGDIFVLLLHLLRLFNLEEQTYNSFLPSKNDILLLKTIIDIDNGDLIHPSININVIESNINSVTVEEKPLIYFVNALLLANDKFFEKAEKQLSICVEEFLKIQNSQAHKICFVYYEFASLLNKLNQKELSEKYFKKGFDLAKEKDFIYYTKDKDKITYEDYINGIEKFDELKIDLAYLWEKSEKESLMTQLHKRLHDYQFLNKLKSVNQKSSNLKKYIEDVLSCIYEYLFAGSVIFVEYVDNEYKEIFSINRKERQLLKNIEIQELFDKSLNRNNCQFFYISDKDFYFGDISQYEYKFGIIIVPSKYNSISADNINTLNIALQTIQSQVIIYKQDENLLFLSTTDTLSLLNNRHSLQQYIQVEGDKVCRYEKRKSSIIQIAIAFIDLDNFKYYNDTFGHSAGDLLISSFAKLLKKTCRQVDFISRFGGDEFVIVMVDTNEKESLRVYERIKQGLKKENYFIPQLEKLLGEDNLNIPQNRHLGFSMGVCTNYDVEKFYELNEVLNNADKALYYSKEHGKGICSFWSQINK